MISSNRKTEKIFCVIIVTIMESSYFSTLPLDLFTPLLLYFESGDLLRCLTRLEELPEFSKALSSSTFWKQIGKIYISSCVPSCINSREDYIKIQSKLNNNKEIIDKIKYLSKNGYDILLYKILSSSTMSTKYIYNNAMAYASLGGHIEIVISMLQRGANNYNWVMTYAAEGGNIEIVQLMLNKGANDYYNLAMESAAYKGHMDIVELMLEKGANNYNFAMKSAAKNGHMEIVKLMLEKGACNYDEALSVANTEELKSLIKSYQNR